MASEPRFVELGQGAAVKRGERRVERWYLVSERSEGSERGIWGLSRIEEIQMRSVVSVGSGTYDGGRHDRMEPTLIIQTSFDLDNSWPSWFILFTLVNQLYSLSTLGPPLFCQ